MKLRYNIEVINDGVWLSGKIGDRPFAIMASDNPSYQNVEIGGLALFGLGYRLGHGVDGLILRPRPFGRYLNWHDKFALHRLLRFAASIPDAETWAQELSEADLLPDWDDPDEFGEFPFWPGGIF